MNINSGYDYGFWNLTEFINDKLTIYEYSVSSLEYDNLITSLYHDYSIWYKLRKKQIFAQK